MCGLIQAIQPLQLPKMNETLSFLVGGGEMGAMTLAFDWEATALGAPSRWNKALRTSIRMLLSSRHPMYIVCRPTFLCFYNDAYRAAVRPHGRAIDLNHVPDKVTIGRSGANTAEPLGRRQRFSDRAASVQI